MTDHELIRQYCDGDEDALNRIADRYYDDIYRFCLYLTGDAEESCDITQEVFLRFMKYMDSYTHRNLKGYLLIIARNLCCDYFSRKEKEDYIRRTNTTSLRGVGGSREGNSGDLEFAHTELRYLLDGILSRLPEEQREVIVLRFGEELKFKEIAKVVGCSQSTVKSRYRLAMARLRKEMEWVED